MNRRVLCIGILVAGVAALLAPDLPATSRDRFQSVHPRELVEVPHKYWSRGVVFQDVLESHPGRRKRIGGQRYKQITTETLGRCYVAPDIVHLVEEMPLGRKYVFSGMVLSETGRNLLGRTRTTYYVVIHNMDAVLDEMAVRDLSDEDIPGLEQFQALLLRAQNSLHAEARGTRQDMQELFDPRAERIDRASELIRTAIRLTEQEQSTTSAEMLTTLIRSMLAAQYLETPEAAVEEDREVQATVETPEPADDTVAGEEAAEERRSWWGARKEAEPDEPLIDEPLIDEPVMEEEEAPRRRWWQRDRDEAETEVEETPPATPQVDEAVTEEEEPAPRRRWWRRDRAPEEPEEEVTEEKEPEVAPTRSPPPVYAPSDIMAPVRR